MATSMREGLTPDRASIAICQLHHSSEASFRLTNLPRVHVSSGAYNLNEWL